VIGLRGTESPRAGACHDRFDPRAGRRPHYHYGDDRGADLKRIGPLAHERFRYHTGGEPDFCVGDNSIAGSAVFVADCRAPRAPIYAERPSRLCRAHLGA
jgi:hypothetical protein